jgi:hypothetical protein
MKVRLRVLATGTRVRIRQPRAGERGTWIVRGRVVGSGLDDPAYDLDQERTGRARILRRSRLRLVGATANLPAPRGSDTSRHEPRLPEWARFTTVPDPGSSNRRQQ